MSKWKPWQLVFLGYLLLLNFVVLCSLIYFSFKNDLFQESSIVAVLADPSVDSPPGQAVQDRFGQTIDAGLTPQPPETETATVTPVPPVNIPPAPLPAAEVEEPGDREAVAAAQLQVITTDTPQPAPTSTATSSPEPPVAPTNTPTLTPSSTPPNTPLPTYTPTSVPSPTPPATATPTKTATSTSTPTKTATPSPTATETATSTRTPRPTATGTPTPKPTPTFTVTPSSTPLPTATPSQTPRPTATPSSTSTAVAVAALPAGTSQTTASGSTAAHLASLDHVPAGAASVEAVPLTNNSIALTWTAPDTSQQYHIYSDMGSGYGVYLYKAKTTQPTYIDKTLRAGMVYNYHITRQENGQERMFARITTMTFATEAGENIPAAGRRSSTPAPSTPTLAPTALPPDAVLLGLLSDNSFTDNFNTLTIVGEVRNDSPFDVGHTDIAVTFYDGAGAVIDTARGETMLDIIPPGETSPFIITVTRPSGFASHSLRAIARPVTAQLQGQLSVAEVKRYEDEAGFLHIKGVIKNVGSSVTKRTKVAAVLYGRDGRVINIGFAYATPATLAPGEQGQYEVLFTYYPRYLTQTVIPFEE